MISLVYLKFTINEISENRAKIALLLALDMSVIIIRSTMSCRKESRQLKNTKTENCYTKSAISSN